MRNSTRSFLAHPAPTALAIAALAVCYGPLAATLVAVWSTNSVYSYGFVVPIVSAYVVWSRKRELASVPRTPDIQLGVPVTLIAAATLLAGRLGAISNLQQLSLIVALAGVILLLFGRKTLRHLWFPVLYLTLMLSVWDGPVRYLQVRTQLASASVATVFLRLSGLPTLQEGTFIVLPGNTLHVLPECSGINQLISILAMTLPAAYLGLRSTIRRTALVAIAPVVALLSNGFRIALVGFFAEHGWASGDLRGMHLMEGLIVAVAGYGVILGCLRLLSNGEAEREKLAAPAVTVQPVQRLSSCRSSFQLAAIALLLASGFYSLAFRSKDIQLAQGLESFPGVIDAWRVDHAADSTPPFSLSGIDDELTRVYENGSGERIRLYIGYHRFQRDGKELAENGSSPLSSLRPLSRLTVEPGAIELNQIGTDDGAIQHGLIFWYEVNGRVVARDYLAKTYTLWDALTRRRTNAAVLAVTWDCPAGVKFEGSRERAIGFVKALLPILPRYLPS